MAAPAGAAIVFFCNHFHAPPVRTGLQFDSRASRSRACSMACFAGLRAQGADVFQLPARNAAEAAERVADVAHRRTCDAVIAAGGDGTFRAVATGAAESDLAVGIIPLGTGNVLAHEIGLPRRALERSRMCCFRRRNRHARGGLFNGAPFFLMTGAGFDARIVSRLNYRTKRAFGRGAYAYPILRTLAEGPQVFDVELDGRRFEASWVILSFASRYGGSFMLTRDTGVGCNRLIAVVVEARLAFGHREKRAFAGARAAGSPRHAPERAFISCQ